jgi:hypothetical protein
MNALLLQQNRTTTCLRAPAVPVAGAAITAGPCNDTSEVQLWSTFDGPRSLDMRIALLANFTLCLAVQGGSVAVNTPIVLARCNSNPPGLSNSWVFDEFSRMRPAHAPNLCLTVVGTSGISRRTVLSTCTTSSSLIWNPTIPRK